MANLPGGNVKSTLPLAEIKHVIIHDEDAAAFTGLSDLENLQSWKTKIQTDLTVHVLRVVGAYENTTAEPAKQTLPNTSRELISGSPAPSFTLSIDSNFYDYLELMDSLRGGTYKITFVLKDGTHYVHALSDGKYDGFLADLTAINNAIPKGGEGGTNFKVYCGCHDFDQFRKAELVLPAWGVDELLLAMPAGLHLKTNGVMVAGDIEVLVRERAGNTWTGKEDLVVADFEVVGSNHLDKPIISALVEVGAGVYTLTPEKGDTPGALAAGDWIEVRVNQKTATVTNYLSNRVPLIGTASGS